MPRTDKGPGWSPEPRDNRERLLTKDDIVDAALDLTRQLGLENLTMRRLADKLGVSVGAAYRHIPNKAALVALVVAHVQTLIVLPDGPPEKWPERLRGRIMNAQKAFHDYPGVAAVLEHDAAWRYASLEGADRLIGLFLSAGFTPEDATRAFCATSLMTHGLATVHPSKLKGNAVREPLLRALQSHPDKYPSLQAVHDWFVQSTQEQLMSAVDLFIDGLKAQPKLNGRRGKGVPDARARKREKHH